MTKFVGPEFFEDGIASSVVHGDAIQRLCETIPNRYNDYDAAMTTIEILINNISCPNSQCGEIIYIHKDYNACFCLECSTCKSYFCAFCFETFSTSMERYKNYTMPQLDRLNHDHVANCGINGFGRITTYHTRNKVKSNGDLLVEFYFKNNLPKIRKFIEDIVSRS